MAKNSQYSVAALNAAVDAKAALADGGYLRIYSGTQPDSAEEDFDQHADEVLLAELRFGNPAFTAAVDGEAAATAITPDTDATATGTASWYRVLESDGTSTIEDGNVGENDSVNFNMSIASTSISQHQTVTCSSFTMTALATGV